MIFEPEEVALFELATEWLPDMGSRARLEAGNPPRTGSILPAPGRNTSRGAWVTPTSLRYDGRWWEIREAIKSGERRIIAASEQMG